MVDFGIITTVLVLTSVAAKLFTACRVFFSDTFTLTIKEFDGQVKSEIYEAAEIYFGNKLSSKNRKIKVRKPEKEKNFKVRKPEKEKNIKVTLEHKEKMKDSYRGHKFEWVWQEFKCVHNPKGKNCIRISEVKSFKLTFLKKHKVIRESYLYHIKKEAKRLKR